MERLAAAQINCDQILFSISHEKISGTAGSARFRKRFRPRHCRAHRRRPSGAMRSLPGSAGSPWPGRIPLGSPLSPKSEQSPSANSIEFRLILAHDTAKNHFTLDKKTFAKA
jgi:hypothetical protein